MDADGLKETTVERSTFREDLEVAISGGGLRAAAFGLGVLLYLADSGLNKRVTTITSVSGGSITNGFVATECDFRALTGADEFRRVAAARLAQIISGRGRFRGFWLASRPYLALLVGTGLALFVWFTVLIVPLLALTIWRTELRPVSLREMAMFVIAAAVWGLAALLRGEVVLLWLSRTFFPGKGLTLGSRSDRSIDHVFCATDLTTSGPLFLSTKGGGRVFSERYGRGQGTDVPMTVAVGASAALPPWIPALRFALDGRRFTASERVPRYVYLSDGGVWNNLGTDWSRLRAKILSAEIEWIERTAPGDRSSTVMRSIESCPAGGVLLIANASKPENIRRLWALKIPVLSFIVTLSRAVNVTVNSTVVARSADLERTARMRMLNDPDRWQLEEEAPRPRVAVWGEGRETDPPVAVAVEMSRNPGETARAYSMIGGLAQWARKPGEYLEQLDGCLQDLKPLLAANRTIPTTFN